MKPPPPPSTLTIKIRALTVLYRYKLYRTSFTPPLNKRRKAYTTKPPPQPHTKTNNLKIKPMTAMMFSYTYIISLYSAMCNNNNQINVRSCYKNMYHTLDWMERERALHLNFNLYQTMYYIFIAFSQQPLFTSAELNEPDNASKDQPRKPHTCAIYTCTLSTSRAAQ